MASIYILPPGIETAQIAPSVRVSSLIFQRSFSQQEYIPNGNNRDHTYDLSIINQCFFIGYRKIYLFMELNTLN
jgi:hypothetical protein